MSTGLALLRARAFKCRIYHSKMTTELVKIMFESTWGVFHRVVATLTGRQRDVPLQLLVKGLDMLRCGLLLCHLCAPTPPTFCLCRGARTVQVHSFEHFFHDVLLLLFYVVLPLAPATGCQSACS